MASLFSQWMARFKISKIGVKPPKPLPDRQGIAVACIVKNEALYIAEWAQFHWQAGVAHFYIYNDGCTDDTEAVLRATLPADCLTIVPWQQRLSDVRLQREMHNQVLAYAHAIGNFGARHRWMAFIDVDEFLVPTKGSNLNQALAHLADVPNVSLPWHMFGTSGHQQRPAGGVLANYLQRVRHPMSDAPGVRAFKCLVDPCRVTAVRVHSMETDHGTDTWNDRGQRFNHSTRNQAAFYSTAAIQLNHYYTRSRQDLEEKMARGPNLLAKAGEYRRKVLRTVQSIEADTMTDTLARDLAQTFRLLP